MQQHFVYILFSSSLNKYYTGSTSNTVEDRQVEHLANHKGYTGKIKDWITVYTKSLFTRQEAMAFEHQIKIGKVRLPLSASYVAIGIALLHSSPLNKVTYLQLQVTKKNPGNIIEVVKCKCTHWSLYHLHI